MLLEGTLRGITAEYLRHRAGAGGGGGAGLVDLVVEQVAEAHALGLVAGGGDVGEVVADRVHLLLLGLHACRCRV